MKSIAIALLTIAAIFTTGCAGSNTIKGVEYQPYGLVNESDLKNPDIAYTIPASNVFMGVLFGETIIVPVYIIGWDLYEPVGIKPAIKGAAPTDSGNKPE